jgi:hypothetical protein
MGVNHQLQPGAVPQQQEARCTLGELFTSPQKNAWKRSARTWFAAVSSPWTS